MPNVRWINFDLIKLAFIAYIVFEEQAVFFCLLTKHKQTIDQPTIIQNAII